MPENVLPERLAKAVGRRSGAFAALRLSVDGAALTGAQASVLADRINEAEWAAAGERSALVKYWVNRTKEDFVKDGG